MRSATVFHLRPGQLGFRPPNFNVKQYDVQGSGIEFVAQVIAPLLEVLPNSVAICIEH